MNLNEVKKHVKFDIIFTLLVCIGLATCLLLTLAYIFRPINAAASTLNETNITNNIQANINCSSGAYCYTNYYYPYSYGTGYINTNTSPLVSFEFSLSSSYIQANAPTTITITTSSNLANVNYSCSVTSFSSVSVPCNVVRTSNSTMNINFTTLSTTTGYGVYVSTGPSSMITLDNNGNGNFKITNVKLLQTIGSNNLDVIDNANQNTQSIIDNSNTNTDNIINSQYENALNIIKNIQFQLEYCSRNLMLGNWVLSTNNMWQSGNDFQQQTADSANINVRVNAYYNNTYVATLDYANNINTTGRKTYRFYKTSEFNRIDFKLNGVSIDTGVFIDVSQLPDNAYYYISANFVNITQGSVQWRDMMISAYDSYFVPWGSQQCHDNKLDALNNSIQGGFSDLNVTQEDIKDIQQDTYNYLSDNSDPTINNTGINNVISSVEVSDPLNYLLTLPISLLQKLNAVLSSNTCSRVSFGELYDTELYLPCINFENILGSTIWGTIDLIVGVGLLAIILKRFYDSISNILTLGKEKEVRDKLDLPTPMQFLASILGGGRD